MAVRVKVSGINILLQDLDKYSDKVKQGVLEEIKDWSVRTEADAKRDVAFDTGALQSTIRSVVSNNGLTWIVKAGGIKGVNYAPYIEFGTGAGVDQAFLQEYGLVEYASDFIGNQEPFSPLPERSFLFRNARTEFEKALSNIKKLIQQT
jgi:hypothetical protein